MDEVLKLKLHVYVDFTFIGLALKNQTFFDNPVILVIERY